MRPGSLNRWLTSIPNKIMDTDFNNVSVTGVSEDKTSVTVVPVDNAIVTGVSEDKTSVTGMSVDNTSVTGVSVDNTSETGVSVDKASGTGVSVDKASVNGVSVDNTSVTGVSVDNTSATGLSEDKTSVTGVSVDKTSVTGVSVDNSSVTGMAVALTTSLMYITRDEDGNSQTVSVKQEVDEPDEEYFVGDPTVNEYLDARPPIPSPENTSNLFKQNSARRKSIRQQNIQSQRTNYSRRSDIPFSCAVCGKVFLYKNVLKRHYDTHAQTRTRAYKCDVCHKGFHYKHSLKTHLGIHRTEKPFKCTQCDRSFSEKGNLKKHTRRHLLKPGKTLLRSGPRVSPESPVTLDDPEFPTENHGTLVAYFRALSRQILVYEKGEEPSTKILETKTYSDLMEAKHEMLLNEAETTSNKLTKNTNMNQLSSLVNKIETDVLPVDGLRPYQDIYSEESINEDTTTGNCDQQNDEDCASVPHSDPPHSQVVMLGSQDVVVTDSQEVHNMSGDQRIGELGSQDVDKVQEIGASCSQCVNSSQKMGAGCVSSIQSLSEKSRQELENVAVPDNQGFHLSTLLSSQEMRVSEIVGMVVSSDQLFALECPSEKLKMSYNSNNKIDQNVEMNSVLNSTNECQNEPDYEKSVVDTTAETPNELDCKKDMVDTTNVKQNESCFEKNVQDSTMKSCNAEKMSSAADIPETLYECGMCGEEFIDLISLHSHLSSVHTAHYHTERFFCDFCGKEFITKKEYEIHTSEHIDQAKYRCGECGQSFGRQVTYKEHIRSHHGRLPYKCDVCGKRFKYSSVLNLHNKTHMDIMTFRCILCDIEFTNKKTLQEHADKHRESERTDNNIGEKGQVAVQQYICNTCKRGFSCKESLHSHMDKHRGNQIYKFTVTTSFYEVN